MAFLLRLTVQKQGASVNISKFNYYFVIKQIASKSRKTHLSQEPPAKLSLPWPSYAWWTRLKSRSAWVLSSGSRCLSGWYSMHSRRYAAFSSSWEACGNHQKWAQGQPMPFPKGHSQDQPWKGSPLHCTLLHCITLAQNQEWIIASLHKLIKYSVITPGSFTSSVDLTSSSVYTQV